MNEKRNIIELNEGVTLLNTRTETFDINDIQNRRFMYSRKHHTLLLGDSESGLTITGSHAEEFKNSKAPGSFDDYIRGWIGYNESNYKSGIIHFAPEINNHSLHEGISCLDYFLMAKGIGADTAIRGFKNIPETKMKDIMPSVFVEKKSNISDIAFYENNEGNLFIRCKINGVQQMGKKLSLGDRAQYEKFSVGDKDKIVSLGLAEKYFEKELSRGIQQSRGLKR